MATTPCTNLCSNTIACKNRSISAVNLLTSPFPTRGLSRERVYHQGSVSSVSKKLPSTILRCSADKNEAFNTNKTPFGYTRKDVILIGVGLTAFGVGLKTGLEYVGVDPLQAGNVVQLVLVLGLTIGWISTYIFRVGNKEMTYVQQLRDYEDKVMQKRLESLTEAEMEALLEQVEEEKQRLAGRD